MAKTSKQLDDRREKFCQEYIKTLNATQAAITAGYAEASARVQGSRLLIQDNITRRLNELKEKRSERAAIDANTVILELLNIARVDIAQIYDEKGKLKPIHEIPENVRRAISGIETVENIDDGELIGETKKIRFWDKNRALELLGKHLELFTDKIRHEMDLSHKSVEELQAELKMLEGEVIK